MPLCSRRAWTTLRVAHMPPPGATTTTIHRTTPFTHLTGLNSPFTDDRSPFPSPTTGRPSLCRPPVSFPLADDRSPFPSQTTGLLSLRRRPVSLPFGHDRSPSLRGRPISLPSPTTSLRPFGRAQRWLPQ